MFDRDILSDGSVVVPHSIEIYDLLINMLIHKVTE
jgi:hypothetical protein